MALYFPVFAPKVFSPQVLIRENKTTDFCLGFSPRVPNAFTDRPYHCTYSPLVEKTHSEWSSYIFSLSKQSSFSDLASDKQLSSRPCCCCCPYHWTYEKRSKLCSSMTVSGRCASKIPVSTKEISKSDQWALETEKLSSEEEISTETENPVMARKRKLSVGDTIGRMRNMEDPFFGHSTIRNVNPCQSSSAKKLRIRRPKSYQCPYCDVCCSNQGQLKGHVRIHTGERPYRCMEAGCNKAFIRNEELTRHRRIHTGERPHKCDVCGKAFSRKDHLNKHVKVHSFETEFLNM